MQNHTPNPTPGTPNAGPHPIENIMRTTMESLTQMIDVNTVVGDPVAAGDGATIIPVSRVSFGFASGGGEYGAPVAEKRPFAGGAGAGASVHPIGFLVVGDGCVRMLPACAHTTLDRLVELAPQILREIRAFVGPAVKEITCPKPQPPAPPHADGAF